MTNLTNNPVKRPRGVTAAIALLLLSLLWLPVAGCAAKPKKQPETIKEFLSQPRPE